MEELFKKNPAIPDYYLVSNYGFIKNTKTGNIRSGESSDDYCHIYFQVNKKATKFQIHRLVAQTFLPNPFNFPVVHHKDGNKKNNRVDNLEWVTYSKNNIHALESGLRRLPSGVNHHNSCLTESDVIQIRMIARSGLCLQKEIGRMWKISQSQVSRIARNTQWAKLPQPRVSHD